MPEITRAPTMWIEDASACRARTAVTEATKDRSHNRGLTLEVTGAPTDW